MKRAAFRRPGIVACLLGSTLVAAAVLPPPAACLLEPTGDIAERFSVDPRGNANWFASGTWTWDQQRTALVSGGSDAGIFLWNPGSHFTGTLTLRLRLVQRPGGAVPRGRLIFAHDAATGAHRWLEVAAGNPGKLTLGQTGTIRGSAPGILQSWRAPVAAGTWLDLAVRVAADKSVTVSLAGTSVFTAAAAPLAPGKVGFASAAGAVEFDEFSYTANPDGEPCVECHAGQPSQPAAANVYEWWDGRRWDALHGTGTADQQGGHGDPGGDEVPFSPGDPPLPVVGCTGSYGCHDMRQPRPQDHRNGAREGHRNGTLGPSGPRSVNAFHLVPAAITSAPRSPSDAQAAFDNNLCYLRCHKAKVIDSYHPHAQTVQLLMPGEWLPLPVDSDITTRAVTTGPDFAVCVSCHDPHGTGVPNNNKLSNRMLRMEWSQQLCDVCH